MTRGAVLVFLLLAGCRDEGVVPREAVAGGDPERGEQAIVRYGCGSCHVIPGVPAATGQVGPPLTDLADRTFLAGRVRNGPDALVRWIRAPREIDSATAMPTLGVGEQDARDIAAYLYTLSRGALGPPHLLPQRWIPSH